MRRTIEVPQSDDNEILEILRTGPYVKMSEVYRAAISRGIRVMKMETCGVEA